MNTRLLSYLVGYQVALTGSRALGRHTENSDWDFLIGLLPEDIEPLLDTLWRAGFRIEAPKDSDVKDPLLYGVVVVDETSELHLCSYDHFARQQAAVKRLRGRNETLWMSKRDIYERYINQR